MSNNADQQQALNMAMEALKHLTVTAPAPGIIAGEEKKEEPPKRLPPKREINLEERLTTEDTYIFKKEKIDFVFCKCKLLPMKTPNTQQLEKMRNEQMERMKKDTKNQKDEKEDQDGPPISESKTEQSAADIWKSED